MRGIRLSRAGRLPLRGHPGPLDRDVHRARGHRLRDVTQPGGNGIELPRAELDPLVGRLQQDPSLDHEKRFVRIGVTMPVERLGHHAHPDDVVSEIAQHKVGVRAGRLSCGVAKIDQRLMSGGVAWRHEAIKADRSRDMPDDVAARDSQPRTVGCDDSQGAAAGRAQASKSQPRLTRMTWPLM